MIRLSIYLFPAIIDMILGGVFFVSIERLTNAGVSPMRVTMVTAVWAATYMVTNQFVGSLVSPKNAAKMLIVTSLFMAVLMVAFIIFSQLNFILYILIAIQAVTMSFFFTPFQVFMRDVEKDKTHGVSWSTGLYTFSWSMGMALGPFVTSKLVSEINWQSCFLLNAVLALLTMFGIIIFKYYITRHPVKNAEISTEKDPLKLSADAGIDYDKMPDYAWLGWVCCGIGIFTVSIVRGYFQFSAEKIGISGTQQGNILALVSATQAVVGLCLIHSRKWMYYPLPIILFGISGLIGLFLFGFTENIYLFYLAAFTYGIYSGSFFFYFVFHSLIHPSRSSRYVSINESVVGLNGIAGPLIAGYLATQDITYPYYLCFILVVPALLFQAIIHKRNLKKVKTILMAPAS